MSVFLWSELENHYSLWEISILKELIWCLFLVHLTSLKRYKLKDSNLLDYIESIIFFIEYVVNGYYVSDILFFFRPMQKYGVRIPECDVTSDIIPTSQAMVRRADSSRWESIVHVHVGRGLRRWHNVCYVLYLKRLFFCNLSIINWFVAIHFSDKAFFFNKFATRNICNKKSLQTTKL